VSSPLATFFKLFSCRGKLGFLLGSTLIDLSHYQMLLVPIRSLMLMLSMLFSYISLFNLYKDKDIIRACQAFLKLCLNFFYPKNPPAVRIQIKIAVSIKPINKLCRPSRGLPCKKDTNNNWIPNKVNKIICGVPISLCFRLFLTSAWANISAGPGLC
jgi:hypothetical protein